MLLAGAAALALLLPGGAGAEWVTNSVSLDSGQCGRNLQVGSIKAASTTALPTFLLQGDGGMSSYAVTIDGAAAGTFGSSSDALVCIKLAAALAEGTHEFVGTELAPRAGVELRLSFLVDTIRPKAPARPLLSAFSDTGKK